MGLRSFEKVSITLRLASLLLIPSIALGQQTVTLADPVVLEVRSADSVKVLQVGIRLGGHLFKSVGVLRPASGTVHMSGPGGVATTPATMELSDSQGRVSLTAPTTGPELEVVVRSGSEPPRLFARGHSVTFIRDVDGQLRVQSTRLETKF